MLMGVPGKSGDALRLPVRFRIAKWLAGGGGQDCPHFQHAAAATDSALELSASGSSGERTQSRLTKHCRDGTKIDLTSRE
jgi:hypothetical protein